MPTKRPSIHDEGILEELCARITEGRGIWKIAKSTDMPSRATIYRAMATDERVASQISRAREAAQDALTDQMSEIMDGATAETWQLARAKVWMMQWQAGKLAPKRYGDVTRHKHSGDDGAGGAIPVRFEAIDDAQLGRFIERLERAASSLGAGGGEGGADEAPAAPDD